MDGKNDTRYAGFWIRLVAEGIDTSILTIVSVILELMLLGVLYWFQKLRLGAETPGFFETFNPLVLQVVNMVLYIALAVPYYVHFQCDGRTTPGKRPFKIFVLDALSRGFMTRKQSLIRCFAYVASYLPMMAGFLMTAFHPEKRALHDLIAGTVSVRLPAKRASALEKS